MISRSCGRLWKLTPWLCSICLACKASAIMSPCILASSTFGCWPGNEVPPPGVTLCKAINVKTKQKISDLPQRSIITPLSVYNVAPIIIPKGTDLKMLPQERAMLGPSIQDMISPASRASSISRIWKGFKIDWICKFMSQQKPII